MNTAVHFTTYIMSSKCALKPSAIIYIEWRFLCAGARDSINLFNTSGQDFLCVMTTGLLMTLVFIELSINLLTLIFIS